MVTLLKELRRRRRMRPFDRVLIGGTKGGGKWLRRSEDWFTGIPNAEN
jgi:hypothetical protein